MSDDEPPIDVHRVLTVFIIILLLFAILMILLGEILVAGVTFLSLTFAIYMREVW